MAFKIKKKNGETYTMTWKEFGARLWPFGKWCIVWHHALDEKDRNMEGPKVTNKVMAINSYIMHQSIGNSAMQVVGIKKVGGLFNGIEFVPAQKEVKF